MQNLERERRSFHRYDYHYDLYLDFTNKNIESFSAKTINISERGAFIQMPKDIDLFERFKGRMVIDEPDFNFHHKIMFDGIIIRKELRMAFNMPDEYYAGLYFEHIEDAELRKLKTLLRNKNKGFFGKLMLKIHKFKETIIDE